MIYNMLEDIINIDNEIMGGAAVFTGTWVPIKHLFDYLESRETLDEFLDNSPTLKRWQVVKILKMRMKFLHLPEPVLSAVIFYRT